jgi:hypothetical protein
MGAVNPAMTRALMGVEKTIDSALELVTNCQEKHTFVHRLFTASDMAKKLARVKDDIHRKVVMCILGLLAISVECYCYTVTVPFSSAHLPPLAQLHQVRIALLPCIWHIGLVGSIHVYGPCAWS